MHPHPPKPPHWRQALLATALAGLATCSAAQAPAASSAPSAEAATTAAGPTASSLKALFDAAWAQQPEAQALQARREAAQALKRAAEAWTPQPATLEAGHRSDRLTRNEGARELELGVAVPLWLPNERRSSAALADAELAATESRVGAAQLRLAAALREAWWTWQRALADVESARGQRDSARRLAADVGRRAQAGDLARSDRNQAEGAAAAAEAGVAQAEAAAVVALQQLKALSGGAAAFDTAALAGGSAPAPAPGWQPEPEPATDAPPPHPALAELQDRATLAERAATLAATQRRANPELTVAGLRERGTARERFGQTLAVAVRIPLGAGPRYDNRVASARADASEAQAQLALDRARLQAEREAARPRVEAARAQLAAAERRAVLARETRGFFEKSFRLGETDLPTRLRIEAEATEAERQAARSRIELAAAISAWRQALGLLPQ